MLHLFVFAALAVAGAVAMPEELRTPEGVMCLKLLKVQQNMEERGKYFNKCVSEQPGLGDIIKEIMVSGKSASNLDKDIDNPDFNCILDVNGFNRESKTLKKCVAREMGYVVTLDGMELFDASSYRTKLKSQVSGTKAQLGLEKCPLDPLIAFDISKYTLCMMYYCATREGPPASM